HGLAAIAPRQIGDARMVETETDLQGDHINLTRFLLVSRQLHDHIDAAVCEVDEISRLFEAARIKSVHVLQTPAPTGHLGVYRHLIEIKFSSPIDVRSLQKSNARLLLGWNVKE